MVKPVCKEPESDLLPVLVNLGRSLLALLLPRLQKTLTLTLTLTLKGKESGRRPPTPLSEKPGGVHAFLPHFLPQAGVQAGVQAGFLELGLELVPVSVD